MTDIVERLRTSDEENTDAMWLTSDRNEAADLIESLRQQLAECQAKEKVLRDALRELVACRDIKDSLPTLTHDLVAWGLASADYRRRKPLAWEKARAVLAPNAVDVKTEMATELKFYVYHPGERQAGLNGYTDVVTVTVENDPGGDGGEFAEYMRDCLAEWFDGAKVTPNDQR